MRSVFLSSLLFCLLVMQAGAVSLEDGVSIPLVADYISSDSERGVFLSALVAVENGSGHVFVDTSPYTQVDLQGSARLAAMVASDITCLDQTQYDFYYVIAVPSPIIGGPSAGAAITVATVAAINNWSIKDGVVMTGTISPDNSIGPVGGIQAKLAAAAENGITLFLIPEGQRKFTVSKKNEKSGPGFVFIEEKTVVVDLVEEGKKLGVEVQEVADIYDAIYLLTGHTVDVEYIDGEVISGDYVKLLEPLAASLKVEALNMYNETEKMVAKDDMLNNADDTIKHADEMYDDGNYYAATSLYFNAMVALRDLSWHKEYDQADNKTAFAIELHNMVARQINASEKDIERYKELGVRDPETIGAAESRVTRARQLLYHADASNPIEYISTLAFSNERARTAQWWLTLTSSDVVVPEEELRNRAAWYLAQAQSVTTYAYTLISESNFQQTFHWSADEDLTNAKVQFERGYYSGSLFDSIHAIVRASTVIGMMSSGDQDERVQKSEQEAKNAILEAQRKGVKPTLAISAYEYGRTLADPDGRITQYNYAKSVAKTSVVLNSKGVKTVNTTNYNITTVVHQSVNKKIEPEKQVKKQEARWSLLYRKIPCFSCVEAISGVIIMFLLLRFKPRHL